MLKSFLDFLLTGLYVAVLYLFYFTVTFILTLFLGLPIGLGVYYIGQVMSHYLL